MRKSGSRMPDEILEEIFPEKLQVEEDTLRQAEERTETIV
jgi:hypothetical protein